MIIPEYSLKSVLMMATLGAGLNRDPRSTQQPVQPTGFNEAPYATSDFVPFCSVKDNVKMNSL